MTDDEIVDLFLARDERALNEIRSKYGRRIRALSLEIVKDEGSAEECENDTYLKARHSIPPNEPKEYLYPFLARITRRLSLNMCRDRSALKRSGTITELTTELEEILPSIPGADASFEDRELCREIDTFLSRQSSEKRAVFVRRYWHGESIKELSRRFGYGESKIKVMLMRMRQELRFALASAGFYV